MFRFSRGYCISFFLGMVFPRPSFLGSYKCSEGTSRVIRAYLSGMPFLFGFLLRVNLLSGVYCYIATQVCVFDYTSWESLFYFAYVIVSNRTSYVKFAYLWENICHVEPFLIRYTMHKESEFQSLSCILLGHSTFFKLFFIFLKVFVFRLKIN